MIELPQEALARIKGAGGAQTARWTLDSEVHGALLAALGRALASLDTSDFVAKKRLAFAVGDEIAYPSTGDEARGLSGNNTAIVQRLEQADPVFHQIVSTLSQSTNRIVSISAYIAEVEARAFSWHVDKWDSAIFQLQGRKAFDTDDHGVPELCPGDALFLAEDVRHRARTLEHSIHLSLAFFPPKLQR